MAWRWHWGMLGRKTSCRRAIQCGELARSRRCPIVPPCSPPARRSVRPPRAAPAPPRTAAAQRRRRARCWQTRRPGSCGSVWASSLKNGPIACGTAGGEVKGRFQNSAVASPGPHLTMTWRENLVSLLLSSSSTQLRTGGAMGMHRSVLSLHECAQKRTVRGACTEHNSTTSAHSLHACALPPTLHTHAHLSSISSPKLARSCSATSARRASTAAGPSRPGLSAAPNSRSASVGSRTRKQAVGTSDNGGCALAQCQCTSWRHTVSCLPQRRAPGGARTEVQVAGPALANDLVPVAVLHSGNNGGAVRRDAAFDIRVPTCMVRTQTPQRQRNPNSPAAASPGTCPKSARGCRPQTCACPPPQSRLRARGGGEGQGER